MGFEVGAVLGRVMSGKGENSREVEGEFHISTLEAKGGYYEGGTRTANEV